MLLGLMRRCKILHVSCLEVNVCCAFGLQKCIVTTNRRCASQWTSACIIRRVSQVVTCYAQFTDEQEVLLATDGFDYDCFEEISPCHFEEQRNSRCVSVVLVKISWKQEPFLFQKNEHFCHPSHPTYFSLSPFFF